MTNEQPHKRVLGRGLSSLIPGAQGSTTDTASGEGMRLIPLTRLALNPFQPRDTFDPDELAELTASIREHGVLQPVVVRPKGAGSWELVAGERRFRAATAAGLKEIPAVVRDLDDRAALALAVIENIQREDLNPIDSARAYRRLQEDFDLTQTEVAREVGKPQPTIANALRLLQLPAAVIESISSLEITEGHGKAILAVYGEEARLALWREVVSRKLSVREAERRAAAMNRAPKEAIPRGMEPDRSALHIEALEEDLSLALGARARIRFRSGQRGVLEVAFCDREELEGVVDRLLRR